MYVYTRSVYVSTALSDTNRPRPIPVRQYPYAAFAPATTSAARVSLRPEKADRTHTHTPDAGTAVSVSYPVFGAAAKDEKQDRSLNCPPKVIQSFKVKIIQAAERACCL